VYGSHPAIYAQLVRIGAEDLQSQELQGKLSRNAEHNVLAERAIRQNQNDKAFEFAGVLTQSGSPRIRRQGIRLQAEALLSMRSIADLVELIVEGVLQDEALAQMLPLSECVGLFDHDLRQTCNGRLSTPILFSLASKHSDSSDAAALSDSYEDFLIANSMSRPSELRGHLSDFPRKQLIYYLREICVPSVMHLSTAFSASRELEDERIAICSLLAQIDESNGKVYETEARDITRTQTIRQGVRRAEQSKIYVDLDAISRWAEINLKEKFARYQLLLAAGIGIEDSSSFTEAFKEAVRTGTPLPREFLEVPKNESHSLLTEIVSDLLNEFTLSSTHGLDCYLSMRIRHGTLRGQLRSPLEEQHLITQRESKSQEYKPNEYWSARLPLLRQEDRQEIVDSLGAFSKRYDDFTDRIADTLVQIRGKDKPEGLFNVFQTGAQLRLIGSKVSSDSSFERFLEVCYENFWTSVGACLRNVRDTIDRDLKAETNAMFGELESEIAQSANGSSTAELDGAIRTARTRAQMALDRVKDWFELSKPVEEPELNLEQLVEIGLQMVRNVHRDFEPILIKVIPDLPPFAWALTFFTDVFFIIFDNIRRHSEVNCPRVEVHVTYASDRLRIIVRSEIGPGVRTPEVDLRLDGIKRALSADLYPRSVRSEGGTGFIKLGKLILRDGGGTLDFGFGEDDRFFIDIELGFVIREEADNESADRRR